MEQSHREQAANAAASGKDRGPAAGFVLIPAGKFEMGDHHGFVDPKHGGDETPIHTVRLDAFYMGINDVTTREYCEFLNSALAQKSIEVRDGGVYLAGGKDLLCETRGDVALQPDRLGRQDVHRARPEGKPSHRLHPLAGRGGLLQLAERAEAAAALLQHVHLGLRFQQERLPAADRGGVGIRRARRPVTIPTGISRGATSRMPTKANWPESKNPFRTGPLPWTTPVGFFNGKLHRKADFGWPGPQETFQTANGANGYGLYDMAGNVWQFINDWYERDYYAYSPAENPPGPASGSPMPDGKPYRGMRGGNWYNGENGHGRVSNRNPSYYRGPQDPDHPYYHLGFRVVLPVDAESRPVIKPTPVVQRGRGGDGGAGPAGQPREQIGLRAAGRRVATISRHATTNATAGGNRTNGDGRAATSAAGRRPVRVSSCAAPKWPKAERCRRTSPATAAAPRCRWSGAAHRPAPESFALIMHHVAPDMTKWYWVLYNIPADVTSLPEERARASERWATTA